MGDTAIEYQGAQRQIKTAGEQWEEAFAAEGEPGSSTKQLENLA